MSVWSAMVSWFCVRPTSNMWFMKIVQVTMKPCRRYVHRAFTYSVGPSSVCEANLDQLRIFHQWECLKCNGHGLLVSCVEVALSPSSLEVNPCNLNRRGQGSRDVPLHMGSKSYVLSPKYDMDAYIDNTFWRWGLELVLRRKAIPNFDHKSPNFFLHKAIKI